MRCLFTSAYVLFMPGFGVGRVFLACAYGILLFE